MSLAPGQNFNRGFVTQTIAGQLHAADSMPAAVLRRNGVTDPGNTSVAVGTIGVGDYVASGTIPYSYVTGDRVEVVVAATVLGQAGELVIYMGEIAGNLVQGAMSVTLVFIDQASNPVPGVMYTVAGMGSGVADSNGHAVVSLNAGTYQINAAPQNLVMFPPTNITVSAPATFSIQGTAVVISAPTAPNTTMGYLTTRDGQGNAVPSKTIVFELINPGTGVDSWDQNPFTATSNTSGLLEVQLVQNSQYQGQTPNGDWIPFTTGTGATYELPEILGRY